jgi:hypothetical protein
MTTARRARTAVLIATLAPLTGAPALAQSVPGFNVTTYAVVDNPVLLSFGPDGTLYVGRDTVASGSATAIKVHRVGLGGAPVTEIGNTTTPDPDALCLDVAGAISGVPGSVLVGGLIPPSNNSGRISAIHPDGNVVTLFESSEIDNPIELKIDGLGRLLFTEGVNNGVWVSASGEQPTLLFDMPGAANCTSYFALNQANQIYTCSCDGVIRIHASNGALIDDNFASVGSLSSIEFGPGGAFGDDLYALSVITGALARIDEAGVVTPVGSGFGGSPNLKDLGVGQGSAAGALYVSRFNTDEVLMIAPATCPGDLNGDGAVDGADLGLLLAAWGTADAGADLDESGTVDGADLGLLLAAWGDCG